MDTVTVNATSPLVCGIRTVFSHSETAESPGNLVHFYQHAWRHFKEDAYISIIQRCQSKILRATVDAPRFVTNDMIHKDLGIPTVKEVIHERSIKHRTKLASHPNPLL